MKNIKITHRITAFLSIIISALLLMSVSASAADQSSEKVQPMTPYLKGNITYYVTVGDKVQQGDPLFLIVTPDNNPAKFYQIVNKIKYYTKIYNRREELIKTHAVSKEELENNLNNLILAKDDLISFIVSFKLGFYVAPYDCEIVSLTYPNGSGVTTGSVPALTMKPTDPNYKFEPKKTNEKLMEVYRAANELSKEQTDSLNVDNVIELLKQIKQIQSSKEPTATQGQ